MKHWLSQNTRGKGGAGDICPLLILTIFMFISFWGNIGRMIHPFDIPLSLCCTRKEMDCSGGSRIAQTERQPTILAIFPENCMKLKEMGLAAGGEGGRVSRWPRLGCTNRYFPQKSEDS